MTLDTAQIELLKSIDWGDFGRNQSEVAAKKKQQLLEMAERNEARPASGKHPLGVVLRHYASPKSGCYDAEFSRRIRSLRPNWFSRQSEDVIKKKAQLLKMAQNGERRPKQGKDPLAQALGSYTNESQPCYDAAFHLQLQTLRPDWFRLSVAAKRKQKLLAMAENGMPKPRQRVGGLGRVFERYIKPSSTAYDPEFHKKVQSIRPDWLVSPSERCISKKQRLLKMARDGKPKPIGGKHPLGHSFTSYSSPAQTTAYDPEFHKQILSIRPDWLMSKADRRAEDKQRLLKMARDGEQKPVSGKHPLGNALAYCTRSTQAGYDPEFDKQIRKLAPHWFKKK